MSSLKKDFSICWETLANPLYPMFFPLLLELGVDHLELQTSCFSKAVATVDPGLCRKGNCCSVAISVGNFPRVVWFWRLYCVVTFLSRGPQGLDQRSDLDETLIRETENSKYVYHVANAFYTPMHGSSEFLSVLNAIPNVQMHFFSSGRECRNIPLVQQIMEGCCLRCSYNIFSMSHMTKESGSWDYKKKLENLGFELPWTIMVDDESSGVAATGEEINFLQMYYFSQSEHLQDREVLRLRRENSLIRALGLIIWALELSMIANCTLVQALVAIQWDQNGKYAHQRTNAIQVYDVGLAAMQKVNPNIVLLGCTNNAMVYPWSELKMDHHSNAHEKFWRIGFGKQKIDRLMMHRLQLDVSLPAVKTRDVEEDLCIDALYCQ
ncbi:hypothetical protein SELMODRAFT_404741 [Selaginella moellendorffii]|uniref:FCP1 homology domain-containing protein n=1 Tax=Selaginella moellendorffii TaxID=88036 RepID=D8QW89_SELML|nr:hypothetical protein SELMODRAFT_404741 [Selaginella moellendorffii]